MGVLFVMQIDTSKLSTHFANVRDVSVYQTEEEILFSMHSIFRIEQIEQLGESNRLWQVNLTLTNGNDPQLYALTERMREETKGSTGWFRLGKLLVKLAHYNNAEDLYETLLTQRVDDAEKGHIFYQLGYIKYCQEEYVDAIAFDENSLEIRQKMFLSEHPDVADCYNSIGTVNISTGEYSKALSYYEKGFSIRQKTLPPNHPDIGESYNNIGLVYESTGDYSKAIFHYETALQIREITLPPNHPDVAESYNNIGLVYERMGEYSKAISFYEKALETREKTLPPNHPEFGIAYACEGSVYCQIGDYPKVLSFYEKHLQSLKKLFLQITQI
jgi:tetratricopeptide (TPR) repeat protein